MTLSIQTENHLAPGDPLVSCFFTVTLDGHALGSWTSCELGGVQVDMEQIEEGGNQGFAYQLPGRLKYQNIKLSRLMDSSTNEVAKWFSSLCGAVRRTTGQIVAYSTDNKPVVTWDFIGAVPVSWSLPALSSGDPSPAVESLEIAHQGFVS